MKNDPKSHPTSRIVRKAGQKKRVNYVSAPKCSGYIQTESTFEASTAFTLSLDPRVASFRPQPCTFDLYSGRAYAKKEELLTRFSGTGYRPKPYTPDFLVRMLDGRVAYVESKAERWVNEELHRVFLPKFFKSLGNHWTLVTDKTLTPIVVSNIRTLKAAAGREPNANTREALTRLPNDTMLFGDLVSDFGLSSDDLLIAILCGSLSTDLRAKRLGTQSLVSRFPKTCAHLEILTL